MFPSNWRLLVRRVADCDVGIVHGVQVDSKDVFGSEWFSLNQIASDLWTADYEIIFHNEVARNRALGVDDTASCSSETPRQAATAATAAGTPVPPELTKMPAEYSGSAVLSVPLVEQEDSRLLTSLAYMVS